MKQVLRKGLKRIVVGEVPDPPLIPHHVLIRPCYSLISSGTETASIHADGVLKELADNPSHLRKIWNVMKVQGPLRTLDEVQGKFREYAPLGYSGAGIVVDKDATVTDLEIGGRVAYGGEGTGHSETVLAGRNLVVQVPEAVPVEHACFTTLGAIALNAVRIADIGVGDLVAVIGLGLVGQLVAQLVRVQGGVVIGVDLREDRVELARRLGADHALVGSGALPEAVGPLTEGRGADCVIVAAASKSAAPLQQAVRICRDRGRVVVVGAVDISVSRDEMYAKELQLLMSRAYGPGSYDPVYEAHGQDYPVAYVRWTENRNMEEFLRLLAAGRVRVQPLITHQFALEEAARAYATIMDPSSRSLAVLLRYPESPASSPGRSEPRRRIAIAGRPDPRAELRVGLVGAGNLARWAHLPNLRKIPYAMLQAVHSSSGARGRTYAERFGAAYAYSDYDEMLGDPALDVVLIVSRHQHHFTQALAALRAGKHVFLEKPMALSDEACRQLARAVEETGRHLTVGFNRRFAPLYLEQKRVLVGRTGPAVLHCRMNSPGLSGSFWAADPAIGGAIVGEGCHFVDLMYWLLESEPIAVSAFSLPTGKRDPIGENNMVASLRFADGSIGNLTYCTVGSKAAAGEHVEAFAPGIGTITDDFRRLVVATTRRRQRSSWWAQKGYAAQLQSFLDAIREGREPAVTVRDGARATIACLRMLESARTLAPCAIDVDGVLSEASGVTG
jgi:predicted dehydrogenase/threonine dehydrogenase-like Zn-dependent dehydrogenase